jgi:hypothetical protein
MSKKHGPLRADIVAHSMNGGKEASDIGANATLRAGREAVTVFTSAKARVAADIIEQLAKAIGHGKAGFWMLTSCPRSQLLAGNGTPSRPRTRVRAAAAALIAERLRHDRRRTHHTSCG